MINTLRSGFLFALIVFVYHLHGQNNDTIVRSIDSIFSTANAEAPGAAIVVVKDGKIIYRRGYGMANIQHKAAITPTTVFDMASVSKQFAAFSISLLAEQGKLSVEDDIRKYLPEMHDFGKKITISHLLHHAGGLRDWASSMALGGQNMMNVSYEQILAFAFNQRELNFEPGAEYSYSNTGYTLLAEVVQRVSGQPFRQWCDSVIFKALGMNNTFVHDQPGELISNFGYGYEKRDGKFYAFNSELTGQGSSSVFSCVDDMAKWMIEMDNPRPEWKPHFTRMFERGRLNNDSIISYAWGLNNFTYRGINAIDHSGSWGAFGSYFIYFPVQHLSVLVLQNGYDNPVRKGRALADLFLTHVQPAVLENPAPGFISLAPAALDKFTGKYKLGPAWYVSITRSDSQLMIQATAEPAVPFMPTSDSTFMAYNLPFVFYKNQAGRFDAFTYKGMVCTRVSEKKTKLSDYTGVYESTELKTQYSIVIENDTLVAIRCGKEKIKLIAACNDDFRGNWFANSVEFYRNKKGKVEGFTVTVSRSRKQRFAKLKN